MFTTFHPIANKEMIKAGKRYNRQRRGLGLEFHEELEDALGRILDNPLAYAADDETGLHLCPLHRLSRVCRPHMDSGGRTSQSQIAVLGAAKTELE